MRARTALPLLLLLAALAGGAAWWALADRRYEGVPPELDPALARYQPLQVGPEVVFQAQWNDGSGSPLHYHRQVVGWELLDGLPHARVEWYYPQRRGRRKVYCVEWLRPGPDGAAPQLLCSQRRIGLATHRLDPPQPVLRGPLQPGHSWSWQGTVGGVPCETAFTVLEPEDHSRWGSCLRVEQRSRLGVSGYADAEGTAPLESRRVQVFAPGRGLIAERGGFPIAEADRAADRMRAKALPPAEQAHQ